MSQGTTPRAIRVDDDLWRAALEKAQRTGVTVTSVLVKRLREWVAEEDQSVKIADQTTTKGETPCVGSFGKLPTSLCRS